MLNERVTDTYKNREGERVSIQSRVQHNQRIKREILVPTFPSVCELHPVVNAKYKKSPKDLIASSLSFQNCGPNNSRTESETDSDMSC